MITGKIIKRNTGEFCGKNKKGNPIISNNTADTNHKFDTALLYFFTSFTSGGFTKVKKPAAFFDLREEIPIPKKERATPLHITNPIIIIFPPQISPPKTYLPLIISFHFFSSFYREYSDYPQITDYQDFCCHHVVKPTNIL